MINISKWDNKNPHHDKNLLSKKNSWHRKWPQPVYNIVESGKSVNLSFLSCGAYLGNFLYSTNQFDYVECTLKFLINIHGLISVQTDILAWIIKIIQTVIYLQGHISHQI